MASWHDRDQACGAHNSGPDGDTYSGIDSVTADSYEADASAGAAGVLEWHISSPWHRPPLLLRLIDS